MSNHFTDRLIAAIQSKKSPTCVGIDPVYSRLPAEINENQELNDETDSEVALDAVLEFCRRVIKVVAPHVAAVKINSAFFEQFYWDGIEGYFDVIQEADRAGLIVIGDSKRCDIGSTAEVYARAQLAEPAYTNLDELTGPDAVTVVPYAGLDGVKPFIQIAREDGKGVFCWVRASNESAAEVQGVKLESGQTFAEHMAGLVQTWATDDGLVGQSGYSAVGAVVAAKDPEELKRLREIMSACYFLVPGYGAQGATAEDIAPAFKSDGTGALVTASRSVIFAYEDMKYMERWPSEWEPCVEQACKDFVSDVTKVANIS